MRTIVIFANKQSMHNVVCAVLSGRPLQDIIVLTNTVEKTGSRVVSELQKSSN